MNRTLLLFIVDFLFLNLIALTRWERAEPARPREAPVNEIAANAVSKDQDLVETMRESLADEQLARQALERKLASSDSTLALRERTLGQLSADSQKLTAQLVDAQRAKADLAARYEAQQQESALARSQLEQLQKDLEDRRAEAERQRLALAALEKQRMDAQAQIDRLSVAVQVGEHEKELLSAKAAELELQVQAERQERAKVEQATTQLAQGVGQLAEKSGELTKEIRDYRPVPPNVLFDDFLRNRVGASLSVSRKGLIGSINRDKQAQTLLVSDGAQVYALMEVEDTPFSLKEIGADWEQFTARLGTAADAASTASKLEFLKADPRVVVIPVPAAQVAALGVKVYPIATDPFRFPKALLISGGAGYGELGFQLDPSHRGYVRVDNRLLKRLVGDFAPSRGDLVLSQAGEILGIMVNGDYCLLLGDFGAQASVVPGGAITDQHTGALIDSLSSQIQLMPQELQ
jgi:X-X-X-Leu-X-X-Gly heptad repeat protein